MNRKFFNLPEKKQQAILNAAYLVFARCGYQKAVMNEISQECGISKSLLFFYFKNKKELYLYLCHFAAKLTSDASAKYQAPESEDFFIFLERSMKARCSLMRLYPYICLFTLNTYYEQNPDVRQDLRQLYARLNESGEQTVLSVIRRTSFRTDLDPERIFREIQLACEGYLYQTYSSGVIDPDRIGMDFTEMIAHWKKIYG